MTDPRINPTTIFMPGTGAGTGYGNYGATQPAANPQQLPPNPYLSGVTSGYLDASGNQQQAPTNPMQFTTQEQANNVASRYGGTAFADQLAGPGNGWSTPQQLVNIPGMQGNLNPGLVTNTLGMYGSSPTSYGQFEVARDIAQNSGQQFNDNYNQWATSQPGFKMDPNLANSGPGYNMVSDGKGGMMNSVGAQPPQQGAPPGMGTPTSFTGANGLQTTGVMNPFGAAPQSQPGVPPGMTAGKDGYLVNGQWIPNNQAGMTPAPPPAAPVPQPANTINPLTGGNGTSNQKTGTL